MMDARQAYILFNMIDGLGPVKVRALLECLGSAESVMEASETDLLAIPGIGRELCRKILEQRESRDPVAEEKRAEHEGIALITPLDEAYPSMLKQIYDPPLALYVKGKLEASDGHGVAVVGSRQFTHYGQTCADRLSYQLAQAGCTVISGLARGIDTVAHEAALKAGGRTLAVIGSALDQLYPPENRDLAERIARQGAIISEYPFGRQADRATFPYRNRIVSGMSLGVLVIEAPVKSGSLITADCALEHGRMVFAVPGRIDQKGSRGCHRLIQQGAKLVEEVGDILEEFEYLNPATETNGLPAPEQIQLPFDLSEEERRVCSALEEEELDVDSLARHTELPIHRLNALLLGMEMKMLIRMLPGRQVALNRPGPERSL